MKAIDEPGHIRTVIQKASIRLVYTDGDGHEWELGDVYYSGLSGYVRVAGNENDVYSNLSEAAHAQIKKVTGKVQPLWVMKAHIVNDRTGDHYDQEMSWFIREGDAVRVCNAHNAEVLNMKFRLGVESDTYYYVEPVKEVK